MKKFFLYVWQLPQNVLGLAAIHFLKPNKSYTLDNGVEIHYSKLLSGGISLGKYEFGMERWADKIAGVER